VNRTFNADGFDDDISIIEGIKNEVVVFENSNDMLSFLGLLKLNAQRNEPLLI